MHTSSRSHDNLLSLEQLLNVFLDRFISEDVKIIRQCVVLSVAAWQTLIEDKLNLVEILLELDMR